MRRELHKELELLNRYYDVDEENKLVTIPLKYEKATELIDLNVEAKNNYPISDPAMVSIVEKISTIPPGYQVKLNLIINDYEGYDENILLESLNDFLEFNHYSIIREKKFFFIQAIILLAIGISILVFNVSAKANELFVDTSVLNEVFDIIAWVFVWQATTVAFLTPSEFDVNSKRFKLRVKSISLYDKDRKLLAHEETFEKFKEWVGNRAKEKLSRIILLLTGGALLISGAMRLVEGLSIIPSLITASTVDTEAFLLSLILVVLFISVSILEGLIGISALSIYNGRGPLSNKARYVFIPIAALIISLEIVNIVLSGGVGSLREIVSTSISILSALGYIVGTALSIALEVKNNKTEKNNKDTN